MCSQGGQGFQGAHGKQTKQGFQGNQGKINKDRPHCLNKRIKKGDVIMKNKMKIIKRAIKAQMYNPENLSSRILVTFRINRECLKPQSYLYKASISKSKAFEINRNHKYSDAISVKSNFL